MVKINIMKPTGSEMLSLLSAFKIENLTYVIFDSEKVGSMGLPIIYISKLTDKLEKVLDDNEWQSVKNSLKGIISGTNYEYVKVADTINADEAFYTPLTLPQSSFDLIKNRYIVTDDGGDKVLEQQSNVDSLGSVSNANQGEVEVVAMPGVNTTVTPDSFLNNINNNEFGASAPETSFTSHVSDLPKIEPVMPTANAASNVSFVATPSIVEPTSNIASETIQTPPVEIEPMPSLNEVPKVVAEEPKVAEPAAKFDTNTFIQDKETFLKACENMFDALVSKYQKQLDDLERREQALKSKEVEVETKLNNANEHLANAEAREQVANIAHDNAQRVMDLNNLMPSNPNA